MNPCIVLSSLRFRRSFIEFRIEIDSYYQMWEEHCNCIGGWWIVGGVEKYIILFVFINGQEIMRWIGNPCDLFISINAG